MYSSALIAAVARASIFDASRNRTHVAESGTGGTPVRGVDYTYDALNRLVSETVVGGTATGFIYDDVGNRLAKDICSGDPLVCATTTYDYNDNNQLVAETAPDETTAYFYDTNGSLLEKDVDDGTDVATTTYAYDARNRMIGAETPDDDLSFAYDVDGIRVSKTVNGSVTNFLIDKVQPYAQVVEERNGTGDLVANYTYGNDLISQTRGASTAYYAYDGLGSTRALTDASGVVTDTYTYDAFGSTTSESGATENAYRFTGEQFEAGLQLYYLRARYYDPAVGRFGAFDTWMGDPRSPLTLNKYLYGDGNPVNGVDPSGHEFNLQSCMMTVLVQGILSAVHSGFVTSLYSSDVTEIGNSMVQGFAIGATFGMAIPIVGVTINNIRAAAFAATNAGAASSSVMRFATTASATEARIGYHATKAEYVESIINGGLKESVGGRAGSGVYVGESVEVAAAEFASHNPSVAPVILEVEYESGTAVFIGDLTESYVAGALPIAGDTLIFESIQAPGYLNILIRNGSAAVKGVIGQ